MTTYLALVYRGSSGVQQVVQVTTGGSSAANLGGSLLREAKPNLGSTFGTPVTYVRELDDEIYAIIQKSGANPQSIYQLLRDTTTNKVRKLILTANPSGGTPVAGETVTGVTSSATGVTAEDYETGDLFVIVENMSATDFQDGELINFSGGASTLLVGSGAQEDNDGEWIKVYSTLSTPHSSSVFATSGLEYFVDINNRTALCFGYQTSGRVLTSVTIDPVTKLWSETAILTSAWDLRYTGSSQMLNGVVYWTANQNTTTNYYLYTFNPVTGVGTDAFIGTNMSGSPLPMVWGDEVITMPNTNTELRIYQITGGSIVLVKYIGNLGSGNFAYGSWHDFGSRDSLNMVYTRGTGISISIIRLVNYNGNIVVNCPNTVNATEVGEQALPVSLQTGRAAQANFAVSRDTETTFLSSSLVAWYYNGVALGTAGAEYNITDMWTPLVSGADATWNGTVGNFDDVVFSSDSGLVAGDWILHEDDNLAFKVVAVTTGGLNVEILDPSGTEITTKAAIPSTPSPTSKAIQAVTFVGTGSIADTAVPNDDRGGGSNIYIGGSLRASITGASPVLGGERISFILYSDSGSTLVDVKGEFLDGDRTLTQMTLSNPSDGSLNGNIIEDLIADNVTEYEVTITSPPTTRQIYILNVSLA